MSTATDLNRWQHEVRTRWPAGRAGALATALAERTDPRTATVRTDRAEFRARLARRSGLRHYGALRLLRDRLAEAGLLVALGQELYRITAPVPRLQSAALHTRPALRRTGAFEPIGFPVGRMSVDWSSCSAVATDGLVINIGDPYSRGLVGAVDAKLFEFSVIEQLRNLLGSPAQDRWGWVTGGSSEAIHHGMLLGRNRHPDALLYASAAAHPCVAAAAAAAMLRIETVTVPVDDHDVLDYAALADPTRPAIVVATVGTTLCEAVDDVERIRDVLAAAGVGEVWVHTDAALPGVPLALDPRWARLVRLGPGGADSLSLSRHKFLSVPIPYGVLLARHSDAAGGAHDIAYVRASNPTTACSRPGVTSLMLWQVLTEVGREGLARYAAAARTTAARVHARLVRAGVDAHRHDHAMTVTFPVPSDELVLRWSLATAGGRAHLIAMPGVDEAALMRFVHKLVAEQSAL